MQGLIGKKIGMTRIFDNDSGEVIPVTIVQTGTNIVQQVKTVERDGYSAVQLGFEVCSEKQVSKPAMGHFKRHNAEPTKITKEFELDSPDEKLESGQKIGPEIFNEKGYVDVVGISKGRGFTGSIKRHNFTIGRKTHGNSCRREHGSIGSNSYPARVFPGMKMAGQYGNASVTIKGLKIVGIDNEAGLVFLRGSIPGHTKGYVYLKKNRVKS
jgi:large subunit ribosomal protein L3